MMSDTNPGNTGYRGEFQQSVRPPWPMSDSSDQSVQHPQHGSVFYNQHSLQSIPQWCVTNARFPLPPQPSLLGHCNTNSQTRSNIPAPPHVPYHQQFISTGSGSTSTGGGMYNRDTGNTHSNIRCEKGTLRPVQPHGYQPPGSLYHDVQSQQSFPNYVNQTNKSIVNEDRPLPPFPYNHQNSGYQPERLRAKDCKPEYYQPAFSDLKPPPFFQSIPSAPVGEAQKSPFLQSIPPVGEHQNPPFSQSMPSSVGESQPPDNRDYHTSSSEEKSSSEVPVLGMEKLEDRIGINSWMNNVQNGINKERNQRATSDLKICDVQRKLLRYAMLLSGLNEVVGHLSEAARQADEVAWEKAVQKSAVNIEDVEELKRFFGDQENVSRIKDVISMRREKRIKLRRGKAKRVERKRKVLEERKNRERKMDERLRRINEEEKEKLEEEKMKKEADLILREVRTKQEEVMKMQKMLEALSKLREIRRKKGEMHGYVEDPRANTFFDKMKSEFDALLVDQQNLYHGEEQTLKVMMEESLMTFPHSNKPHEKPRSNPSELKKSIFGIYFGKNQAMNKEYEKSFLAAEESVEILVKRRKDWDQFLVPDDNSNGSSVPIGWVVPNMEPNEDWKTLQHS